MHSYLKTGIIKGMEMSREYTPFQKKKSKKKEI